MFHQVAHFLLHQAFGQLHLELFHQGCDQSIVTIALLPVFGVVLETLLQISAQLSHRFLIAGLLGESIVEFR